MNLHIYANNFPILSFHNESSNHQNASERTLFILLSRKYLECSEIIQIKNNNYYVIVKTGQADSSGSYFKIREIKQCCHFL